MDIVGMLAAFHGCARREQLLAAGATWDQIEAARRAGEVLRRHRGVYALPNAPRDVVVARVFRAQVGCLSAARHWGIRELPRLAAWSTPHLVVPRNRSLARMGLRGNWEATIHYSGSHEPRNLWVPFANALDQMADCVAPLDQLIAIDGALYDRKIRPEDLDFFVCGTERRREWLRERASALSESLLETVTGAILDAAGYPFEAQREITRVGRTDFVLEDGTVVEADGFDPHGTRKAFREDRRRGRELQLQGRGLLRYAFEDIVRYPLGVVLDVAKQLGRDPHPDFRARWFEITSPTGFRTANPSGREFSSFA